MDTLTRPRFVPALVLLLYLLLATLYAVVTPLFEKPDENWHFAFAMYLVESGDLPVQRLAGRDHLAEQEGSQPPLYYALLAGVLKGAGLDELSAGYSRLTVLNPYYGGRAGAWLDNANQFVHGPCVGACRATARAVRLGRALSILCGLAALLAAAAALRLAFPDEPALLWALLGMMAFNPQFLHISSSVSNDALTVATVSATLALALWWRQRPGSAQRAVALGVAAGLAALSKPSGLSAVAVAGLFLLVAGGLGWQRRLRQIVLYGATFLLVSGWWFLRNLRLYGEPTATAIHLQIYGTPAPAASLQRFVAEWTAVTNSYWASFGWGGVNLADGLYDAVRWLAMLLALSFVVALWRRWRAWDDAQRSLVALLLLHLFLVGALLVRWMRLTVAPLGRLLFPASLSIAFVLALGLCTWLPRRWQRPLVVTYSAGWALAALAIALLWVQPRYAPAPLRAALPADAIPLDVRFGDAIRLVGYALPDPVAQPGEALPLTLYWQALRPLEENFSLSVKGFGRGGQLLAQADSYPDAGRWPTSAWPVGPLIPDRTTLLLAPDAEVPTLGRVEIDVFRLADLSVLPATVGGQAVRPVRPFALVVRGAEPASTPSTAFRVRPVAPEVSLADGSATVEFVWEVGQPLDQSYQAFLHLTPAPDQPPLAQRDFEPLGGDFPTAYWQPGDRLRDRSAPLPLPTDAAPGEYELLMGLYDLESGQRVEGEPGQSAWVVGELRWDGTEWHVASK